MHLLFRAREVTQRRHPFYLRILMSRSPLAFGSSSVDLSSFGSATVSSEDLSLCVSASQRVYLDQEQKHQVFCPESRKLKQRVKKGLTEKIIYLLWD